ncbi:hypothetical protein WA026_000402 [Henosepilachna vigintioctopunctata]|uniref:Uncharacterized protein n=1 Tax=Henosepilachna vigintioctopunctata TaxID=420089 RepID=A0AAW1UXI3_9CUCU
MLRAIKNQLVDRVDTMIPMESSSALTSGNAAEGSGTREGIGALDAELSRLSPDLAIIDSALWRPLYRQTLVLYGRVQSVKLLPRSTKEETGESSMACTVAFMDIKSASKAHNTEHKVDDRTLTTEYYEPAAIPSAASPQTTTSPYSTSPGSNRFPNGHR